VPATQDKTTYTAHGLLILLTTDKLEEELRAESADEGLIQRILKSHRESHPDGEITRKGGWQNDLSLAFTLEVHAWGKEKTIEYLDILTRAALEDSVAA